MIEIKHKVTGKVLRQVDADTLVDADLTGADLHYADLNNAQLGDVDLSRADLRDSNLYRANLIGGELVGAHLTNADLRYAQLKYADLRGADLSAANLAEALLCGADLSGADLSSARIGWTVFAFCHDLHEALGLESVVHQGPSSLDPHTLRANIHKLPGVFLEGCGYSRHEIETLRALYNDSPIKFFSCFISHGKPDLPFAERLLADLRQNNVTCWHYKDDMRGGTDWEDQINRAIKFHDKLVLVCSHSSVYRKGVVKEILQAIKAEHETGEQKLFPVRLDDHILSQEMLDDELRHVKADLWPGVWVEEVKRKHIPDFSGWDTDNAKYQGEFKKLLEALQKSDATKDA